MVIEGASVSVKTMSDGTLRLSIDIEPRNAQDAFALFGAPGRAVALAALKDGAGAVTENSVSEKSRTNPGEPEKPKGGEWAKLAGMWCNDPDFCTWLQQSQRVGPIESAEGASKAIRQLCGITSRVELDHNEMALRRFNQTIRHPFMKWMQARGIQK